MDVRDKAVSVRKGEELDPETIRRFLVDAIPGLRGDITIRQFPAGYSNLTYLITIGDMEMVLRRPPFGRKAKTAHDMSREYRMLSALRPVFRYCPHPLVFAEDETIIGCPFYVMERIRGIILRRDIPAGITFSPEQARKLCERLIDVHLELHTLDYRSIGLGDFAKPEGYVERQVLGWSDRYRAARTDDAPDFESVMAWIREKMPADTDRPTVIHNDYRLDNVVLDEKDPMRIVGVLDWEMATIGDPLMDLGSSLAYWVQKSDSPDLQAVRLFPVEIASSYTREQFVRRYGEKSGRTVGAFDFYYCFGLFRLAVIAQQIYYRSYHGQTQDERFKALIFAIRALERAARRVIEASKL
jgi:aminoglycoside phosphotransferase (APT) family kinase protein